VDEFLGLGLEDLVGRAGALHLEVDVGGGLLEGEGRHVVAHVDPVGEVGVVASLELVAKGLLAAEQDLEGGLVVLDGRSGQQPKVGEGLRLEHVRLVDDEERGALGLPRLLEDLEEEALLAAARLLSEIDDDELEEARGGDAREVDVERPDAMGAQRPENVCEKRPPMPI